MITARYHLEKAPTPEQGIDRVWNAGLCLNDEETSAVMSLVSPDHRRNHIEVFDVWLVKDTQTQRDVGMAMVSVPERDSGDRPVLNLYVNADHQHQGLGKALLASAQAHYQGQQLAGFYTLDACRLYHQAGLFPTEIRCDPKTFPMNDESSIQEAAADFVANVLRERQAYEEEMVRHQRRRLRPF